MIPNNQISHPFSAVPANHQHYWKFLNSAAMGVTILHPYPLPENKTGAQTIEALTKRILAVSA